MIRENGSPFPSRELLQRSNSKISHSFQLYHFVHLHERAVLPYCVMQKTRFHVCQTLSYKNGYSIPLRPRLDVGGQPLPMNQLDEADLDELANTRPTLTYGNPTEPAPVEFVPAHVAFDKKVKGH